MRIARFCHAMHISERYPRDESRYTRIQTQLKNN